MKTLVFIMLLWLVPAFVYSSDSTRYTCKQDTQRIAKVIIHSASSQALYSPYRRHERFQYWNWCYKRKEIIVYRVYAYRSHREFWKL